MGKIDRLLAPRTGNVLGFVLALACGLALHFSAAGARLEHALLDQSFLALRALRPAPVAQDVVVIGIDDATYAALPEPRALWHPHWGVLLEAMAQAQPRLLLVDLVLPERDFSHFRAPDPADPAGAGGAAGYDVPLLKGLRRLTRDTPVALVLAQSVDPGTGAALPLTGRIMALLGPAQLGAAALSVDVDGVLRRIDPVVIEPGATLVGRAARALGLEPPSGLVNFALGEPFGYVPLHEVLARARAGDVAWLQQSFAGRLVVVGSVVQFEDRHLLPVPLAAWEPGGTVRRQPGALFHAQALRSLERGFVAEAQPALVLCLLVAASLLWWLGGRPLRGAAMLAGVLLLLGTAALLLLARNLYLPVAVAGMTAAVALAGRSALEAARATLERRRLRASFGAYVSPNVMREILDGRLAPGTEGASSRVCVMFTDIRGFTSLSETLPPREVIAILNEYFEVMAEIVHRHAGTIDKFIGDGLMAFFGAPNALERPAAVAFRAATDMVAGLARVNARLAAQGRGALRIGIGLHVGEAIVGHVGSRARNEFTVIGDTVNLAARLEGLSKPLGYTVVCSAEARAEIGDGAALVPLGLQPIKGRREAEVFGFGPVPAHGADDPAVA